MGNRYALEDNKVGLVKLLIPKVADSSVNGYDVAEFLYGPNVTRPLDGLGSSLAELYEYVTVILHVLVYP